MAARLGIPTAQDIQRAIQRRFERDAVQEDARRRFEEKILLVAEKARLLRRLRADQLDSQREHIRDLQRQIRQLYELEVSLPEVPTTPIGDVDFGDDGRDAVNAERERVLGQVEQFFHVELDVREEAERPKALVRAINGLTDDAPRGVAMNVLGVLGSEAAKVARLASPAIGFAGALGGDLGREATTVRMATVRLNRRIRGWGGEDVVEALSFGARARSGAAPITISAQHSLSDAAGVADPRELQADNVALEAAKAVVAAGREGGFLDEAGGPGGLEAIINTATLQQALQAVVAVVPGDVEDTEERAALALAAQALRAGLSCDDADQRRQLLKVAQASSLVATYLHNNPGPAGVRVTLDQADQSVARVLDLLRGYVVDDDDFAAMPASQLTAAVKAAALVQEQAELVAGGAAVARGTLTNDALYAAIGATSMAARHDAEHAADAAAVTDFGYVAAAGMSAQHFGIMCRAATFFYGANDDGSPRLSLAQMAQIAHQVVEQYPGAGGNTMQQRAAELQALAAGGGGGGGGAGDPRKLSALMSCVARLQRMQAAPGAAPAIDLTAATQGLIAMYPALYDAVRIPPRPGFDPDEGVSQDIYDRTYTPFYRAEVIADVIAAVGGPAVAAQLGQGNLEAIIQAASQVHIDLADGHADKNPGITLAGGRKTTVLGKAAIDALYDRAEFGQAINRAVNIVFVPATINHQMLAGIGRAFLEGYIANVPAGQPVLTLAQLGELIRDLVLRLDVQGPQIIAQWFGDDEDSLVEAMRNAGRAQARHAAALNDETVNALYTRLGQAIKAASDVPGIPDRQLGEMCAKFHAAYIAAGGNPLALRQQSILIKDLVDELGGPAAVRNWYRVGAQRPLLIRAMTDAGTAQAAYGALALDDAAISAALPQLGQAVVEAGVALPAGFGGEQFGRLCAAFSRGLNGPITLQQQGTLVTELIEELGGPAAVLAGYIPDRQDVLIQMMEDAGAAQIANDPAERLNLAAKNIVYDRLGQDILVAHVTLGPHVPAPISHKLLGRMCVNFTIGYGAALTLDQQGQIMEWFIPALGGAAAVARWAALDEDSLIDAMNAAGGDQPGFDRLYDDAKNTVYGFLGNVGRVGLAYVGAVLGQDGVHITRQQFGRFVAFYLEHDHGDVVTFAEIATRLDRMITALGGPERVREMLALAAPAPVGADILNAAVEAMAQAVVVARAAGAPNLEVGLVAAATEVVQNICDIGGVNGWQPTAEFITAMRAAAADGAGDDTAGRQLATSLLVAITDVWLDGGYAPLTDQAVLELVLTYKQHNRGATLEEATQSVKRIVNALGGPAEVNGLYEIDAAHVRQAVSDASGQAFMNASALPRPGDLALAGRTIVTNIFAPGGAAAPWLPVISDAMLAATVDPLPEPRPLGFTLANAILGEATIDGDLGGNLAAAFAAPLQGLSHRAFMDMVLKYKEHNPAATLQEAGASTLLIINALGGPAIVQAMYARDHADGRAQLLAAVRDTATTVQAAAAAVAAAAGADAAAQAAAFQARLALTAQDLERAANVLRIRIARGGGADGAHGREANRWLADAEFVAAIVAAVADPDVATAVPAVGVANGVFLARSLLTEALQGLGQHNIDAAFGGGGGAGAGAGGDLNGMQKATFLALVFKYKQHNPHATLQEAGQATLAIITDVFGGPTQAQIEYASHENEVKAAVEAAALGAFGVAQALTRDEDQLAAAQNYIEAVYDDVGADRIPRAMIDKVRVQEAVALAGGVPVLGGVAQPDWYGSGYLRRFAKLVRAYKYARPVIHQVSLRGGIIALRQLHTALGVPSIVNDLDAGELPVVITTQQFRQIVVRAARQYAAAPNIFADVAVVPPVAGEPVIDGLANALLPGAGADDAEIHVALAEYYRICHQAQPGNVDPGEADAAKAITEIVNLLGGPADLAAGPAQLREIVYWAARWQANAPEHLDYPEPSIAQDFFGVNAFLNDHAVNLIFIMMANRADFVVPAPWFARIRSLMLAATVDPLPEPRPLGFTLANYILAEATRDDDLGGSLAAAFAAPLQGLSHRAFMDMVLKYKEHNPAATLQEAGASTLLIINALGGPAIVQAMYAHDPAAVGAAVRDAAVSAAGNRAVVDGNDLEAAANAIRDAIIAAVAPVDIEAWLTDDFVAAMVAVAANPAVATAVPAVGVANGVFLARSLLTEALQSLGQHDINAAFGAGGDLNGMQKATFLALVLEYKKNNPGATLQQTGEGVLRIVNALGGPMVVQAMYARAGANGHDAVLNAVQAAAGNAAGNRAVVDGNDLEAAANAIRDAIIAAVAPVDIEAWLTDDFVAAMVAVAANPAVATAVPAVGVANGVFLAHALLTAALQNLGQHDINAAFGAGGDLNGMQKATFLALVLEYKKNNPQATLAQAGQATLAIITDVFGGPAQAQIEYASHENEVKAAVRAAAGIAANPRVPHAGGAAPAAHAVVQPDDSLEAAAHIITNIYNAAGAGAIPAAMLALPRIQEAIALECGAAMGAAGAIQPPVWFQAAGGNLQEFAELVDAYKQAREARGAPHQVDLAEAGRALQQLHNALGAPNIVAPAALPNLTADQFRTIAVAAATVHGHVQLYGGPPVSADVIPGIADALLGVGRAAHLPTDIEVHAALARYYRFCHPAASRGDSTKAITEIVDLLGGPAGLAALGIGPQQLREIVYWAAYGNVNAPAAQVHPENGIAQHFFGAGSFLNDHAVHCIFMTVAKQAGVNNVNQTLNFAVNDIIRRVHSGHAGLVAAAGGHVVTGQEIAASIMLAEQLHVANPAIPVAAPYRYFPQLIAEFAAGNQRLIADFIAGYPGVNPADAARGTTDVIHLCGDMAGVNALLAPPPAHRAEGEAKLSALLTAAGILQQMAVAEAAAVGGVAVAQAAGYNYLDDTRVTNILTLAQGQWGQWYRAAYPAATPAEAILAITDLVVTLRNVPAPNGPINFERMAGGGVPGALTDDEREAYIKAAAKLQALHGIAPAAAHGLTPEVQTLMQRMPAWRAVYDAIRVAVAPPAPHAFAAATPAETMAAIAQVIEASGGVAAAAAMDEAEVTARVRIAAQLQQQFLAAGGALPAAPNPQLSDLIHHLVGRRVNVLRGVFNEARGVGGPGGADATVLENAEAVRAINDVYDDLREDRTVDELAAISADDMSAVMRAAARLQGLPGALAPVAIPNYFHPRMRRRILRNILPLIQAYRDEHHGATHDQAVDALVGIIRAHPEHPAGAGNAGIAGALANLNNIGDIAAGAVDPNPPATFVQRGQAARRTAQSQYLRSRMLAVQPGAAMRMPPMAVPPVPPRTRAQRVGDALFGAPPEPPARPIPGADRKAQRPVISAAPAWTTPKRTELSSRGVDDAAAEKARARKDAVKDASTKLPKSVSTLVNEIVSGASASVSTAPLGAVPLGPISAMAGAAHEDAAKAAREKLKRLLAILIALGDLKNRDDKSPLTEAQQNITDELARIKGALLVMDGRARPTGGDADTRFNIRLPDGRELTPILPAAGTTFAALANGDHLLGIARAFPDLGRDRADGLAGVAEGAASYSASEAALSAVLEEMRNEDVSAVYRDQLRERYGDIATTDDQLQREMMRQVLTHAMGDLAGGVGSVGVAVDGAGAAPGNTVGDTRDQFVAALGYYGDDARAPQHPHRAILRAAAAAVVAGVGLDVALHRALTVANINGNTAAALVAGVRGTGRVFEETKDILSRHTSDKAKTMYEQGLLAAYVRTTGDEARWENLDSATKKRAFAVMKQVSDMAFAAGADEEGVLRALSVAAACMAKGRDGEYDAAYVIKAAEAALDAGNLEKYPVVGGADQAATISARCTAIIAASAYRGNPRTALRYVSDVVGVVNQLQAAQAGARQAGIEAERFAVLGTMRARNGSVLSRLHVLERGTDIKADGTGTGNGVFVRELSYINPDADRDDAEYFNKKAKARVRYEAFRAAREQVAGLAAGATTEQAIRIATQAAADKIREEARAASIAAIANPGTTPDPDNLAGPRIARTQAKASAIASESVMALMPGILESIAGTAVVYDAVDVQGRLRQVAETQVADAGGAMGPHQQQAALRAAALAIGNPPAAGMSVGQALKIAVDSVDVANDDGKIAVLEAFGGFDPKKLAAELKLFARGFGPKAKETSATIEASKKADRDAALRAAGRVDKYLEEFAKHFPNEEPSFEEASKAALGLEVQHGAPLRTLVTELRGGRVFGELDKSRVLKALRFAVLHREKQSESATKLLAKVLSGEGDDQELQRESARILYGAGFDELGFTPDTLALALWWHYNTPPRNGRADLPADDDNETEVTLHGRPIRLPNRLIRATYNRGLKMRAEDLLKMALHNRKVAIAMAVKEGRDVDAQKDMSLIDRLRNVMAVDMTADELAELQRLIAAPEVQKLITEMGEATKQEATCAKKEGLEDYFDAIEASEKQADIELGVVGQGDRFKATGKHWWGIGHALPKWMGGGYIEVIKDANGNVTGMKMHRGWPIPGSNQRINAVRDMVRAMVAMNGPDATYWIKGGTQAERQAMIEEYLALGCTNIQVRDTVKEVPNPFSTRRWHRALRGKGSFAQSIRGMTGDKEMLMDQVRSARAKKEEKESMAASSKAATVAAAVADTEKKKMEKMRDEMQEREGHWWRTTKKTRELVTQAALTDAIAKFADLTRGHRGALTPEIRSAADDLVRQIIVSDYTVFRKGGGTGPNDAMRKIEEALGIEEAKDEKKDRRDSVAMYKALKESCARMAVGVPRYQKAATQLGERFVEEAKDLESYNAKHKLKMRTGGAFTRAGDADGTELQEVDRRHLVPPGR